MSAAVGGGRPFCTADIEDILVGKTADVCIYRIEYMTMPVCYRRKKIILTQLNAKFGNKL